MTIHAWSVDEWGPGACHCGDSPPPTFQVPPPPQPPYVPGTPEGRNIHEDNHTHCEEFPATCSAPPRPQDYVLPVMIHVPFFLVISATVTLVILIIIATGLVYRMRHCLWAPKGCPHAPSVRIYGNISSYQHPGPSRKSQRLRPSRDSILGIPVSLQLCPTTNHNQHHHEHLYQSISSGSDTCSYTTTEGTQCHKQVHHLNSDLPLMYSHAATDSEEENIQLHNSPTAQSPAITSSRPSMQLNTSSDAHSNYSNIQMLESTYHNLPLRTQPCLVSPRSRFLPPCATCGLFLLPNVSTNSPLCHPTSNSSRTNNIPYSCHKNSYYMSHLHTEGSTLSPEERGLPPLPSRSARFKAYFLTDHMKSQQRDKHIRWDRQQKWKICQCNHTVNQNTLGKSPHFIFNHNSIKNCSKSNSIKVGDAMLQDSNKSKSKNLAYFHNKHDETRALPQYSNEISVTRSRIQHQMEIEPLYENCNDA